MVLEHSDCVCVSLWVYIYALCCLCSLIIVISLGHGHCFSPYAGSFKDAALIALQSNKTNTNPIPTLPSPSPWHIGTGQGDFSMDEGCVCVSLFDLLF